MTDPEENLRAAERVAQSAGALGLEVLVIGATALAAHRYIRQTDDVDLGVNATPEQLRTLATKLEQAGFTVELREADGDDPLGGVLDVRGAFGLVQVVNFGGRFPAVIDDALREATQVVRAGSPLRLVPLPHLVALKLYAGGLKSKSDVAELLIRNPEADREALRQLCRRYRLRGLEEVLREVDSRS